MNLTSGHLPWEASLNKTVNRDALLFKTLTRIFLRMVVWNSTQKDICSRFFMSLVNQLQSGKKTESRSDSRLMATPQTTVLWNWWLQALQAFLCILCQCVWMCVRDKTFLYIFIGLCPWWSLKYSPRQINDTDWPAIAHHTASQWAETLPAASRCAPVWNLRRKSQGNAALYSTQRERKSLTYGHRETWGETRWIICAEWLNNLWEHFRGASGLNWVESSGPLEKKKKNSQVEVCGWPGAAATAGRAARENNKIGVLILYSYISILHADINLSSQQERKRERKKKLLGSTSINSPPVASYWRQQSSYYTFEFSLQALPFWDPSGCSLGPRVNSELKRKVSPIHREKNNNPCQQLGGWPIFRSAQLTGSTKNQTEGRMQKCERRESHRRGMAPGVSITPFTKATVTVFRGKLEWGCRRGGVVVCQECS